MKLMRLWFKLACLYIGCCDDTQINVWFGFSVSFLFCLNLLVVAEGLRKSKQDTEWNECFNDEWNEFFRFRCFWLYAIQFDMFALAMKVNKLKLVSHSLPVYAEWTDRYAVCVNFTLWNQIAPFCTDSMHSTTPPHPLNVYGCQMQTKCARYKQKSIQNTALPKSGWKPSQKLFNENDKTNVKIPKWNTKYWCDWGK